MEILLGRENEYERAKRLLNAGHHPTFIGRNQISRQAKQGGLIFASVAEKKEKTDAAVALINVRNSTLMVLNVHPKFRSMGVGGEFLRFLRPNFARVVESAVPWFQKQGYLSVGALKQGRTLRTEVMVRAELVELSGKAWRVYSQGCPCAQEECAHLKPKLAC